MSIKIIATDLDGTLMSTDHLTVTERTLSALRNAHNQGVKLAIATGRPMALIDNVLEQVPFADYVIYSNGACVFDRNQNKIIYTNLISNEKSKEAITYFLNKPPFFEVYINGRSHYQTGTESKFMASAFPTEFLKEVATTMTPHDNLLEYLGDGEIEKITLYSVDDSEVEAYTNKMISFDFAVASSFKGTLEGTAKTADKGTALKGVCEILGITPDEVMSFGDAGNDCTMLEFAKYSFAMENGTDECKASAKFIAKSNGEDGLAQEVEKILTAN